MRPPKRLIGTGEKSSGKGLVQKKAFGAEGSCPRAHWRAPVIAFLKGKGRRILLEGGVLKGKEIARLLCTGGKGGTQGKAAGVRNLYH